MNIVVPIKQVPETSDVQMDPEKGTIVRSGRAAVVNPLDQYAIEAALRIGDEHDAVVTAISMGPSTALSALRVAVAMGCDNGVLVSDGKFGGSDTWATSYILSRAIQTLGHVDLIICGERATDGDTAQVGPGIAAWLDISLATYVSSIHTIEDDSIGIERLVEDGYQRLTMRLPGLLTTVKEIAEPRLPTLAGKKRSMEVDIPILTADDLDLDRERIGLRGSPTRVVKIETPKVTRGGRTVDAQGDAGSAAKEIARFLKARELV